MIRAIILDIEGTTTSIDFVHQTLFPYARMHLRDFLAERENDGAVRAHLSEVSAHEGRHLSTSEAADVLERWIDEDRKATPLKALQGMIWKRGYQSGELKGHMYPDTAEYLKRWHEAGKRLYVYSSGSVEAQKLIFGHTDSGDLNPLFSGYFDTRVGGKREAASYSAILRDIGLGENAALFLSDVGEELDAARNAGMKTCQLHRRDNTQLKVAPGHPAAKDFSEVAV